MAADQVVCPFFGGVFERLNLFIYKVQIKKLGPLAGLAKELKILFRTFLKIKEVLGDAEEKQFNENADRVRFWLQELNDAAYEADDVFDEFEYEAQQIAKEGVSSSVKKVRKQLQGKIQKLTEIFQDLAEECSELDLQKGVIAPGRISTSLLTEPEVYGRDTDREMLVNQLLCSDQNISVFSILGTWGLGKTTLAQLVYNHEQVKMHFSVRSWVCVSDDFDIKRLVKAFVASDSGSETDLEDIELLQWCLQKIVGRKRFLLVLDDVWEERQDEWNKLMRIFSGGCGGSSIIVTTRLPTVASIASTLPPYHLKGLSEEDCWYLFKRYAFGPGNEERPALAKIGKQIVKKCEGLPLAAKAMGCLLRFKNEEKEWDEVKDSTIWELNQSMQKQCFVRGSIFPKYKMRKRRVDSIMYGKLFFANPSKNRVGGRWEREVQPNKQDLVSIKRKLDNGSASSSSAGWCICRVPAKFRKTNEYAYTPEIISIGPFHRDKEDLKGMEVHKLRYVNSLLSRFKDRATKLEECVEAISRLEDEARKCYPEPIELNKEEFVEMMTVDSLFIIELFRRNAGEGQIDKDDPVFNVWGLASLVRDLILLENQLPMLVLERLFNITMASQQGGKQLSELAIYFFNPLMQREDTVLAKYFKTGGDHLLDMLSKTFYDFPSQQLPHGVKSVQVPELEIEVKDVPSLTKLRDSGVKFKKGNNSLSFLDINFSNGVIEIPPILIRDQNFSFIRNVIAYEQGLVGHPAQMTSYVVLMNNLIQSSNDVAFLREHGIIRNYLSDDELVSSQFQKLHYEINLANFHHSKLCIDVNAFRVTYIQKATSVLKNVYRRVVPTRWVLLAAGSFLTFDAFKLTLATTECTDLYLFNWKGLDFLRRVLLGVILIVMFWSDSY